MSDKESELGGRGQSLPPTADSIRVVLCTFPNAEKAREVGAALVGKKLAACMNLVPTIESIYRWEGKVQNEPEALAIFKTAADTYPEFERELMRLHPYNVAEIIALEPAVVAEGYRKWVLSETRA